MNIHSSAILPKDFKPGKNLVIGPFSIIEEGVELADEIEIGSHCHIFSGVSISSKVKISKGAVIGSEPQDLKYKGEDTKVIIGENTTLREFVTVNGGTAATGKTVLGKNSLIMAYSHVAHDCIIGDEVIIANGVQMGGHVTIGNGSVISGMTGIHQFTTIGAGVYVGGGLRVAKDVIPFSKALGEPLTWAGVNTIALKKLNLDEEKISHLKIEFVKAKKKGSANFYENLISGLDPQIPDKIIKEFELFFKAKSRGLLF